MFQKEIIKIRNQFGMLKICVKIRWEENAPKHYEWSFLNCGIMADFSNLFIQFFYVFCNEYIVTLFESEKENCVTEKDFMQFFQVNNVKTWKEEYLIKYLFLVPHPTTL